jgi:hypothetical protein
MNLHETVATSNKNSLVRNNGSIRRRYNPDSDFLDDFRSESQRCQPSAAVKTCQWTTIVLREGKFVILTIACGDERVIG